MTTTPDESEPDHFLMIFDPPLPREHLNKNVWTGGDLRYWDNIQIGSALLVALEFHLRNGQVVTVRKLSEGAPRNQQRKAQHYD